jgi:hypothetical protein
MSNKFKIIHTSKKTGVETVIFDNTSDSVIEDVGDLLIGVPITESVDDGMSTAVLHLKSCKGDVAVPALFEPYDKVEVQKSANSFMRSELYIVAIDNRKVDNENLKTYEKTISLVEATKILDSIFIYNCNLTNKTDTLKEQIAKLLNNAEIGVEKSRWLQCEAATATYSVFNGYKSEDFFFDNITLREALYRIFGVAHFRPHVSAINYVGGDIKYINIEPISQINTKEINSLANAGDFIGDEAEISIDNYFGTIKARGYNSISKNTIKTGELPFTTSEAQLTTNNMIADLGFPIEDIKSFKVGGSKIRISVHYYRATVPELTYVDLSYFYDITDKIVDNSIYSLLSKDEQNLTMPYTKGDSTIGFSKSYKTLLFTHSSISEILNLDLKKGAKSDIYKYCKENNIADTSGTTGYLGNVGIDSISFTNGIESLFFQAEFIPRFNTVIEISKPGVYDNDRLKVAIADNQSANTIDIARHGRALAGLARRTGNEEITPNFICNGFSNLLPVMGKFTGLTGRDSYLNDYVITKREYAIYDDYLKVKYYCTKDYQAINEKIGVDREKRLYNIPLESSDCPIYVKYYVTVDITAKTNSTGFKAAILYNAILNFVLNSYNDNFRLAYLYLATKEARSEQAIDGKLIKQLEDNQYFVLPLLPYASDKCINFIAQPLDNYSVGYSRSGRKFSSWGGGGMQMLYNPYTDKNGECDGFTVCLASRQSVANNVSSYPKVTKGGETLISDDVQISYKKDRTQRPVFFIAFEFLPSKELYGKVVFGEAIASQNFLVVSEAPEKRYVYSSGEIYREGETKIKGARVGEALNYFIPSLHDTEKTVYLRVQKDMPLSSSIKAYAIGDESGNLLIAFNMALTKDEKLYFNISRKL